MKVTDITDADQMRAWRAGYKQGRIEGAKAERERIAAAIAAAAPREDPLHRDAIREAAEDAYLTCWTIARGGE